MCTVCVCMRACVRACARARVRTQTFTCLRLMSVSNALCILLKPYAFSLPLTVDRNISAQTQTLNLKKAPTKNEALLYGIGNHTKSRESDPPVGKPALGTEMGAGRSTWPTQGRNEAHPLNGPSPGHLAERPPRKRPLRVGFALNFVLRAFHRNYNAWLNSASSRSFHVWALFFVF